MRGRASLRFVVASVALGAVCVPFAASASAPNCAPSRSAIARPLLVEGVKVTSQDVRLECLDTTWPRCAFAMKLALVNGLPAAVEAFENPPREWTFEVDGQVVPVSSVKVPGRGEVSIVVRGEAVFSEVADAKGSPDLACGEILPNPIYLRHVLFAKPKHTMEARLPRVRTVVPTVTVVAPAARQITSDAASLRFATPRVGSPLRIGGPFAAVGARWGRAKTGDVTVRAGYEIGQMSWLIESVAVETDFQKSAVLVPAAEVTIGGLWYQMFALGVGLPVRFASESAVGIRGQFAFQFPIVGFVAAVDYYPMLPSEQATMTSALGQVSF